MKELMIKVITFILNPYELTWMIKEYEMQLVIILLILAICSCFWGIICHRGMACGLVLFYVIGINGLWLLPWKGKPAAVTVSAVAGVAITFLTYRLIKFANIILNGSIVLALIWLIAENWLQIGSIIVIAVLAEILTCYLTWKFPDYSLMILTELWGITLLLQIIPIYVVLVILLAGSGSQYVALRWKNREVVT